MSAPTSQMINGQEYVLTFNDEFNDTQDNFWDGMGSDGVWSTSFSPHLDDTRYLASNNEQQYYVDASFNEATPDLVSPFTETGGNLEIQASPLTAEQQLQADGQTYSSGLLTTEMSFKAKSGYIEMRADIPAQTGFWTAFWLLPADGDWSSEIDVFEVLGQNGDTVHTNIWVDGVSNELAINDTGAGDGFHTYGLMWDDTGTKWYIDGVLVRESSVTITEEMFLATGLAVEGWAGATDGTTDFSDTYKIDYIRVYELESDADRNEAIMDGQFVSQKLNSKADDVMFGSRWDDFLQGDELTNKMYGKKGDDHLDGAAGDDELFGQDGHDMLFGGSGNDKLVGGKGNDMLTAGSGTDHLWGGKWKEDGSEDVFVFDTDSDKNFVHDFEVGTDRIDLSATSFNWSLLSSVLQDHGWATKIGLQSVGGDYGDMVYLVGIAASDLTEDDFILNDLIA